MQFLNTILILPFVAQFVASTSDCKCAPGDPCWPSEDEFSALNRTVSGSLVRGVPPGSVCYQDQPNYNETDCDYVLQNWLVSTFHAENPVSVGWPQWIGNPCPPIYPNGTSANGDPDAGSKGCHMGGYPVYALNATDSAYVQAVVRFANEKNIRLTVKSTGHSFQGRNTGFGSISIWTHNMQGIRYHDDFQPDSCSSDGTQMAFSIAAGARVRNVYEAANRYDAIVVAGSAQDVGIVGWFTGGGHGPLSRTYGMGVDNVLQMTVVTPTGDLVVANECQHPDLFWAIRGGGGGTFGIITEVVMKAYPTPNVQTKSFYVAPTNTSNTADWWDAVTYFWSDLPRLKEGGLSGYFSLLNPLSSIIAPSLAGTYALAGSLSVYGAPNGTAESLFEPISEYMASFNVTLTYVSETAYYPTFFSSWDTNIGYEAVGGGGGTLGSRLLTNHSLTSDISHLRSTLQNISSNTLSMHGLFIANSENRNLNVSLNPAWRDAVVHALAISGFLDNATETEQQTAYNRMTYEIAPQLKALAPDSGAYFNEGDAYDPDWQYTYFGENYAKLAAVKRRYDPNSVLWCRTCVGSEEWVPVDRYGSGIHGEGRLCKAEWVDAEQQRLEL